MDVEEMKRLVEKATDGPWCQESLPWSKENGGVFAGSPDLNIAPQVCECENPFYSREEYAQENRPFKLKDAGDDAAFIAASRTFIPQAISTIEAQQRALEVAREDAIKAALTMLKPNNGITDTVWLVGEDNTTLYEHLLDMAGIDEMSSDVDQDIAFLEQALTTIKKLKETENEQG